LSTPSKAIVALVLALLLALPLVGTALARPIVPGSLDAKLDSIQDAIDRAPVAAGTEKRDNHGWYVSRYANDFDRFMGDARVGTEDLSRGRWVSMFSRWLKRGADLEVALKAKADAKAAKVAGAEERKQTRAEARGQDEGDDDARGLGRENAPGQKQKSDAQSAELNRGMAKKAERTGN
jgi:hypothetical protein